MNDLKLNNETIRFIVTDVKHHCSECAFNTGGCNNFCEVAARRLGVFATYAVVTGTPEKEYYGC